MSKGVCLQYFLFLKIVCMDMEFVLSQLENNKHREEIELVKKIFNEIPENTLVKIKNLDHNDKIVFLEFVSGHIVNGEGNDAILEVMSFKIEGLMTALRVMKLMGKGSKKAERMWKDIENKIINMIQTV